MASHENLVSCKSLRSRLDSPQWRILDCRSDLGDPHAGRRAYLGGHIPGALFVDLEEDLSGEKSSERGRHPLPEVAMVERRLGELGIDSNTNVVVYDANSGALASRAWWTLRWLGHSSVFLLDGGVENWLRNGYSLTAGNERVAPRRFEAQPRNELILTTADIVENVHSESALNLFDARETGRFLGEFEPIDPVAGHIPGALSLPLAISLEDDMTWKTGSELEAIWLERLGNDKNVSWSVMCGSGVTACHLALSGVEAGFREPRLYVGSWSEWIRDPGRPVVVGQGS